MTNGKYTYEKFVVNLKSKENIFVHWKAVAV